MTTKSIFEVTWQIDIEKNEADNPREAAEICLQLLRDPGSTCVVFEVKDTKTGLVYEIDLDDKEESCDLEFCLVN